MEVQTLCLIIGIILVVVSGLDALQNQVLPNDLFWYAATITELGLIMILYDKLKRKFRTWQSMKRNGTGSRS